MTFISKSVRFLVSLATVAILVPSLGLAQAGKQSEKQKVSTMEPEIEQITVTAEKREEDIQEIPVSVTALSSEALEEKGVTNVVDLGQAVPNVRIVSNIGSPASTTVSIRGLTQGDPNAALQPAVGMYVDGAYISKIVGSNLDVEDLERVEVLRGPQGTLYGRNTIGGAVNFITKKPTDERSVTLKTEAGNFDTFNGRATFNVPLIGKNGFAESEALGKLSLRQNAGYKTHDGFYQNTGTGSSNFDNLNRVYTTTALRWEPSKDVTVDYAFEYHRYRDHPTAFQLSFVYPGSAVSSPTVNVPNVGDVPNPFFLVPFIRGNRVGAIANNAIFKRDLTNLYRLADDGNHRLHIVNGAWDLGELGPLGQVTVKSISSYRSFTYQADQDLDGSPAHVAEFSQINDIQHWSEELQWIGTAPRVNYVAGAYYYGEYGTQNEDQVFFGGANNLPYKNLMKTKSYAPYGQATWTPPILGDKLSVTAGIRYTQEQVHMDHNFLSPAFPFSVSGGKGFGGGDGISPMGDIAYQWTDDLMTYFRISRGFKGGGFTPTAPTPDLFLTFKPETLLAYEIGVKSQWFDKRLRINADGFFSQYSDLQVSVFRPSPTLGAFSEEGNADRAEIWGMEFEGAAIPVRGVEASVSYSFLAPKYTKWIDAVAFDPVTGAPTAFADVSEQRTFAHTPRHQTTVGLTYTAPPTTTGTFSAHVDTYWQDEVAFITNNQTLGAQADEGWAYALVNGRLQFAGIPFQHGNLDVALFARNLLDRKYRTYGIDFGPLLGYAGNVYGNPRTFGVQLIYSWNAA